MKHDSSLKFKKLVWGAADVLVLRPEQSVKDLQESVGVSLMRYRGGTANYLEILDSQRSLFQAELVLAQAPNNEYQSLVQPNKTLGGAWR